MLASIPWRLSGYHIQDEMGGADEPMDEESEGYQGLCRCFCLNFMVQTCPDNILP